MEFSAQQIATYLSGTIEGNPEAVARTFEKIEEGEAGALSFLANPKYTHHLYETQSSIVLVNKDLQLEKPVSATLIRVDNAYESIARLLSLYESMTQKRSGVHPLAFVSETATLGEDVYVGPFAVIGDQVTVGDGTQIYSHVVIEEGASVGENCLLYPHVSIYHGCKIGNEVILHSGCVIGADGFGFAPSEEGYEKIPQIGIVTLEDRVEIGANACVDRSTSCLMACKLVHKLASTPHALKVLPSWAHQPSTLNSLRFLVRCLSSYLICAEKCLPCAKKLTN